MDRAPLALPESRAALVGNRNTYRKHGNAGEEGKKVSLSEPCIIYIILANQLGNQMENRRARVRNFFPRSQLFGDVDVNVSSRSETERSNFLRTHFALEGCYSFFFKQVRGKYTLLTIQGQTSLFGGTTGRFPRRVIKVCDLLKDRKYARRQVGTTS